MDDTNDTRPARAAHNEFGPVKRKKFIASFARYANISHACREAGIARVTYYRTMESDPEFAEAVRLADEEATELLEVKAFSNALQKGSETSLWNLLKARRPQKYRDTTDHNIKGEVVYKVTRMPTDEL